MTQKDKVIELLKEKNGILTSGEVKEAGVAYKTLQRISRVGEIEYPFRLMFEERDNSIKAYNLNTYLQRKLNLF